MAFRSNVAAAVAQLPGAGQALLQTAALFTGSGPSASLVSQLDMGEFSRVRCLKTETVNKKEEELGEAWVPGQQYFP